MRDRPLLPDKPSAGELKQIATDPEKAGPIGLHGRHPVSTIWRTGPLDSRSAAGQTSARSGTAIDRAGMFNPRYLSHQNLVVMDAAKKEYRIKQPLERLRTTDRAVRGSSKGGCAMGRKSAALGFRFGAGLMFVAMLIAANFVSTPAAAQGNCPPGQVFVPIENKCVGLGGVGPAQKCPQGQEFDERANRCVTAGGVRCPQGQEFDQSTNRCVTAGRR